MLVSILLFSSDINLIHSKIKLPNWKQESILLKNVDAEGHVVQCTFTIFHMQILWNTVDYITPSCLRLSVGKHKLTISLTFRIINWFNGYYLAHSSISDNIIIVFNMWWIMQTIMYIRYLHFNFILQYHNNE